MAGIAGVVDLTGERLVPAPVLRAMADALNHRGPDGGDHFQHDGVSLACRRLHIIGSATDAAPIFHEDCGVAVVCDGQLSDYPERRAELEGRGHRFRSRCDAELIAHLWAEHGTGLVDHLHGPFALALWDARRRRLFLARDRFGVCPLHWSRQGDWLLFASEVKGLLASGLVPVRPDVRGINQIFTFFALPGPPTCFAGVTSLLPAHYLGVPLGQGVLSAEQRYWDAEFPDQGKEERGDLGPLVNRFEEVLLGAVRRRLRADVPVTAYLSGGVDSSIVLAMACKLHGGPLPAFTVGIDDPRLDETSDAARIGRHLGVVPTVVRCGTPELLAAYPRLVAAAEVPVIDTACATLMLLAARVREMGFRTALSGEGADELLGSYPWFRLNKLLSRFDIIPGLPVSLWLRHAFLLLSGSPRFPPEVVRRVRELIGGHNGWLDIYGLMSMSKLRFFSAELRQALAGHWPYQDLGLDPQKLRRMAPLHRELYLGVRGHIPGLLMHAKGDRAAMSSAVALRYPFLDEEVFTFLARLHPSWKLRGLREKYILRCLAERWIPRDLAWKRKALFTAPFEGFHADGGPPYVEQLYSPESLRRAGYFDPAAVAHWRQAVRRLRLGSTTRSGVEMGLVGVLSTQLWHHLFIDPGLCELPGLTLVPDEVAGLSALAT